MPDMSFGNPLLIFGMAVAAPLFLVALLVVAPPCSSWRRPARRGAALVGAGLLSVAIFPALAPALLRRPAPVTVGPRPVTNH